MNNRIDKTIFSVLSDISKIGFDRSEYWKKTSVPERFETIEMLRRINYGNDSATSRLQRIFEITELKKS